MNSELSYNTFTQRVYNQISLENNQNFVVSPLSLFMSLLICYAGSKGATNQQLKQLLDIGYLTDQQVFDFNRNFLTYTQNNLAPNPQVNIVNKLYLHEDFKIKTSFENLIQNNFKSSLKKVNFENSKSSANLINEWVASQTNQKIQQIIQESSLNEQTKMVLVNAIYFKASWMSPFDTVMTTQEDFFLSNGISVKVPMMKIYNVNFKKLFRPAGIDASTVEIPYSGEKISMTIVLPNKGVNLEQVEKQLKIQNIQKILSLRMVKEPMNIFIPKFSIESDANMKDSLVRLGTSSLFDLTANFTGISDQNGLMVSDVLHKNTFEINEDGTEATSASAINFGLYAHGEEVFYQRINFVCNKPFLFIVHEKTYNNILFIGKYVKP
ncbi:unnamed protein product [Brachionus calyciflorus]|uniref:Serpin domain-containing protein n=1 Tax=Brachionus calyciflorus TaxID=104777 RepID=A0A813Z791_9BILA|nr:unnamed protein product [Brachionus calyciflorus]